MANKTVVLYQYIKIGGKWTYRKAPTRRLPRLPEGAYYLSWYEGTRKRFENVGPDPDVATVAFNKKSAELKFIATGGEVKQADVQPAEEERGTRKRVTAAIKEYRRFAVTGRANPDTVWRKRALRRITIAWGS